MAILVSLQECGFLSLELCTGQPTLKSHRSKLGLSTTSSNTIIEVSDYFLLQNKKQRKMVREAVLKSKDPQRILEEIEKIETLGN